MFIKPGVRRPQADADLVSLNCFCAYVYICVCLFVCVCVCVCVCVSPPLRLLITSGVIWTPSDRLNKFYSCYIANVVVIVNERGLGIGTHCRH